MQQAAAERGVHLASHASVANRGIGTVERPGAGAQQGAKRQQAGLGHVDRTGDVRHGDGRGLAGQVPQAAGFQVSHVQHAADGLLHGAFEVGFADSGVDGCQYPVALTVELVLIEIAAQGLGNVALHTRCGHIGIARRQVPIGAGLQQAKAQQILSQCHACGACDCEATERGVHGLQAEGAASALGDSTVGAGSDRGEGTRAVEAAQGDVCCGDTGDATNIRRVDRYLTQTIERQRSCRGLQVTDIEVTAANAEVAAGSQAIIGQRYTVGVDDQTALLGLEGRTLQILQRREEQIPVRGTDRCQLRQLDRQRTVAASDALSCPHEGIAHCVCHEVGGAIAVTQQLAADIEIEQGAASRLAEQLPKGHVASGCQGQFATGLHQAVAAHAQAAGSSVQCTAGQQLGCIAQ